MPVSASASQYSGSNRRARARANAKSDGVRSIVASMAKAEMAKNSFTPSSPQPTCRRGSVAPGTMNWMK